jgi:hypothetical protein
MNTYWGVKLQLHAFLTSARDGGEWSASHPRPESIGEGSVWGPRPCLDKVAKRNIPCPCRESNPGRSAHSRVTILTELSRLILEETEISFLYVLLNSSKRQLTAKPLSAFLKVDMPHPEDEEHLEYEHIFVQSSLMYTRVLRDLTAPVK